MRFISIDILFYSGFIYVFDGIGDITWPVNKLIDDNDSLSLVFEFGFRTPLTPTGYRQVSNRLTANRKQVLYYRAGQIDLDVFEPVPDMSACRLIVRPQGTA